MKRKSLLLAAFAGMLAFLASCQSSQVAVWPAANTPQPISPDGPTPLPTRTVISPGELVDYAVQSGDTLPAIAAHFNTEVDEIRAANPEIPVDTTTLPPGFPLQIPAYHVPLTGTPFHILPDSEVINGPSAVEFNLREEVQKHPGFLAGLSSYVLKKQRPAWEVIDFVARNYSIHPRLLLTLLEYQSQGLSNPFPAQEARVYPMGYRDPEYRGLYQQLIWAAERLSDGYYGWRTGTLREIKLIDGRVERPDPWQNPGTVSLQAFFAGLYGIEQFHTAVGPEGLRKTYQDLWGEDPFDRGLTLIPANLQQPPIRLPFLPEVVWTYSAGPHYAWGTSLPYGAVDFAPPAVEGGCAPSDQWVAAPVEGWIVRSEEATVVLDLDEDRDERTGWVLFFFHLAQEGRIEEGVPVEPGDLLGHPSCEGGRATGTHVHVARKYNGEWLPAYGPLPFEFDGWRVEAGDELYQGTMVKGSKVVEACTCTTSENRILYELPQP
jgi:hypothetical protein